MNNTYSPVVILPRDYTVFDLSTETLAVDTPRDAWGVGKYNEKRLNVYKAFYHGDRDIHIGIDLFGPVGTEVHAFADGEILLTGINEQPGDYGPTIICKHWLADGSEIYALYGHLSAASVEGKAPGQRIKSGEVIAWIGSPKENGGWPPHTHFQLSREAPEVCDMPGTASDAHLHDALVRYPDPRTVLGPLY